MLILGAFPNEDTCDSSLNMFKDRFTFIRLYALAYGLVAILIHVDGLRI
jgi:hypothetical protein